MSKKEAMVDVLTRLSSISQSLPTIINDLQEEINNPVSQTVVYQVPLTDADSIATAYRNLPIEEKKKVYNKLFSLDQLGPIIDNKLILISLIVSFVLAARKNQPELTVLDGIKRLVEVNMVNSYLQSHMDEYLEKLAIIVEDYMVGVNKGNTFGIKTAAELKAKVNELLNNLMPF